MTSCHATNAISLPEGAKAWIVGVEAAAGPFVRASDGIESLEAFASGPEVFVSAAGYSCPLDVLGIDAGLLDMLPDPVDALELPPPIARLEGRGADLHEASGEVPAIIRRIALREDNLCRIYGMTFTQQSHVAAIQEPVEDIAAVVPMDSSHSLVSLRSSRSFVLDHDRLSLTEIAALDDTRVAGGAVLNDGVLIVNTKGDLFELREDFSPVPIPSNQFPAEADQNVHLAAVDGSLDHLELLAITDLGMVARFRDSEWSVVVESATTSDDRRVPPKLVEIDDAWFGVGIGRAGDKLFKIVGDVAEAIALPEGYAFPISIQRTRLGVLVGTLEGSLLFDGKTFTPFASGNRGANRVLSVVEAGGALVFVRLGRRFEIEFSAVDPVVGFCDFEISTGGFEQSFLSANDGFIVLTRTWVPQSSVRASKVSRVGRPPECLRTGSAAVASNPLHQAPGE